jgi:hypothetical protein
VLSVAGEETAMDFTIPADVQQKLAELDDFIAREIAPLERDHQLGGRGQPPPRRPEIT